jgi:hypothetical protein
MPEMDRTTQLIFGGGLAVAIVGVLGIALRAWLADWSGLILILVGIIAAVVAYFAAARTLPANLPVATRDMELTAASIAAALGVLFAIEILVDIDNLSGYGSTAGLVATLALAVAGIVLLVGALNRWATPLEPLTVAWRNGDLGTRLTLAGAGIVLVGWLGNVTFGGWYLEGGSELITWILLGTAVMRAIADPQRGLTLPFPAPVVALVLTGIAAVIAIQRTTLFLEGGHGIDDWAPHLLAVGGVALAVAGTALASYEAFRVARPAAGAASGGPPSTPS